MKPASAEAAVASSILASSTRRLVRSRLVAPLTRGDPESPLRWTCKSTSHLARELSLQGHPISARAVAQLLNVAGYSLQGNRKTLEGAAHPDHNAQFEHINAKVKRFQQRGQPVISVDTKKKELMGPYKNNGREWQRKGEPERVDVHDFPDPELGKVIPYGVFDLSRNEGWVSVGSDHDTAQFAAQAIGRWWHKMGSKRYRHASALLITANGGASNASRCRLWKVALQSLVGRLGLPIPCVPFPAGNQQMEQDRASHVLSHHPELARSAFSESRSYRQSDRQHYDTSGLEDSSRTGSRQVPDRHQDHRRGTSLAQSQVMANGTTRSCQTGRKHSYFIYARVLSGDVPRRALQRCMAGRIGHASPRILIVSRRDIIDRHAVSIHARVSIG